MTDLRLHSPAADRNKAPILEHLLGCLPASGTALEIASGSGQHVAHFAAAMPGWRWQPSEAQATALPSIAAWTATEPNVLPAVLLDVMAADWPLQQPVDAIYCANLLHIAPWAVCGALMAGAARHLVAGGSLLLYGPYVIDGEPTAPSNLAFDADLKARNPAWGLRRLADVLATAAERGLTLQQRWAMPANNQLLWLRRG
jgi:hypothetical protein